MKLSIGVDLHKTQFTVCLLSEDIRRVLKSRSILVKTVVALKNQIHGLLLGYGIETIRGQLQSKKERQRILTGLEDHEVYGSAAKAVIPLIRYDRSRI